MNLNELPVWEKPREKLLRKVQMLSEDKQKQLLFFLNSRNQALTLKTLIQNLLMIYVL